MTWWSKTSTSSRCSSRRSPTGRSAPSCHTSSARLRFGKRAGRSPVSCGRPSGPSPGRIAARGFTLSRRARATTWCAGGCAGSGSKSFIRALMRPGTPPMPPNREPASRRSCTWGASSVIKEWRSPSGPWHSRARRVPTWSSKSPEGATTARASSAWRGRWAWARLRGSSGSCPRRISVACCVVRGRPCWRARRRVGASRTWRQRRAVPPRSRPTVPASGSRFGTPRPAFWCRTAMRARSRTGCLRSLPIRRSWRGWVALPAGSRSSSPGSGRRGPRKRISSGSSLREADRCGSPSRHATARFPTSCARGHGSGSSASRGSRPGRMMGESCSWPITGARPWKCGCTPGAVRCTWVRRAGRTTVPRWTSRWPRSADNSIKTRPGGVPPRAAAPWSASPGDEAQGTRPARPQRRSVAARGAHGRRGARSRDSHPRGVEPGARARRVHQAVCRAPHPYPLETEVTYLASLDAAARRRTLETLLQFELPCVVISKGQEPPPELVDLARAKGVAVIRTRLKTAEFYRRLKPFLDDAFAPATTVHASLADVFGVGLLFLGRSGIGKSECVLDLVERGHRLVADDVGHITRRGNDLLIGRGHELSQHYIEILGIGLIDIRALFGVRAVRQQKRIEVVVQLEDWDATREYDRTGIDGQTTQVLEVTLPIVTVPLNPGKNLTVVCEVVAMNHLLRYSGVDSARAFNDRLLKRLAERRQLQEYLEEDNE